MSGWLDEWGLDQTSTATPMAWIRSDNLLSGTNDTMAGMNTTGGTTGGTTGATTGATTGGMGDSMVDSMGDSMGDGMPLLRLATSIVNGQEAEIALMTDMLAKRGVTS